MDNGLIALDLDDRWQVSPVLHAQRSQGEKELVALNERRVVRLPSETDFRPGPANRRWRLDRLRRS